MNKPLYIFIDESGTLPDPKDNLVIVAAIGTSLPDEMLEVTKKVRKRLRLKGKGKDKELSEIKFYRAGEKTKEIFLEELVSKNIDIFTLTIEKNNQRISDTPENFAFLCWLLLEDCLLFYTTTIKEVVFDRHFHKDKDRQVFDKSLIKLLGKNLSFCHVDSSQDFRVNVADMVAGSTL